MATTVATAKSKGQSKEHTLADPDSDSIIIIKRGSAAERGVGGVDGKK